MLHVHTQQSQLEIRPSAVIVDLDHTLYDYDISHERAIAEVRNKMCHALHLSALDFDEMFYKARKDVKQQLTNTASSHSRLQYFQRMLELIGMKSDVVASLDYEQTYWRTFLSCSKLFPGAKDTLLLIRSMGIPLVLLTDLNTRIQFRKIVYFGLETVLDYVVTSEEVGANKPDVRMFHRAMDKLGLAYDNQVWMIGDNDEKDGAGSKQHLNALYFHRHTKHLGSSSSHADVKFGRFNELSALIKRLSGNW